MEENIKIAPKFATIFQSKNRPSHENIIKLSYWISEFIKSELMPCYGEGSFGNLSFRTQIGSNSFIITASGLKDVNSKDNFVEITAVDFDKCLVYAKGARFPSSESLLHYAIYKQRSDINAVFHGHCEAILKQAESLNVPETLSEEPYGSLELVKSVVDIASEHNFIIIKNHGFLSFGKSMDEAGFLALGTLKKTITRDF